MRLYLRGASRLAATAATVAPRQYHALRSISSTAYQRQPAAKKDDVDELEDELAHAEMDGEMDPAQLQRALKELRGGEFEKTRQLYEHVVGNLGGTFTEAMRLPRATGKKFWNEDEADTEMVTDESDADKFDEDDIMTIAHAKFEEFREYREYARIAAWQMPLLSSKRYYFFWDRL
jgi:small subunit ribosomal protein S35